MTACRVQALASDGLCAVDYCPGCGVFHLKVGFVRLNLDPDSFAALCGTVTAALARHRRATRAATPDPGHPLH